MLSLRRKEKDEHKEDESTNAEKQPARMTLSNFLKPLKGGAAETKEGDGSVDQYGYCVIHDEVQLRKYSLMKVRATCVVDEPVRSRFSGV